MIIQEGSAGVRGDPKKVLFSHPWAGGTPGAIRVHPQRAALLGWPPP
jgi:hypothetical protein